jgi:hypothetical protein
VAKPIPPKVIERVLSNVVMGPDGCHISMYSVASHGYAQIGWMDEEGRTGTTAHRVAWTGAYGPIPEGMTVHHQCHNRRCVNIRHLELLSNLDNARRNAPGRDWPRDGTCINGHDAEHWKPWGTQRYRCRLCANTWKRERRRRVSAEVPLICVTCGSMFEYTGSGRRRITCSEECKKQHRASRHRDHRR